MKSVKIRCGCNTHGFGVKSMCQIHSAELRHTAREQTKFAYKWFKIAEQYMLQCKCNGSCTNCQEFNKAVIGG